MAAPSPTLTKQKNLVLPFSRRTRRFWQKIPVPPVAQCDQKHSHAKFAPLDFIDKKIIGKRGKPNIPSRGVHSQEMPGTEVPLGWVAIFELRYRDGSRFLPFGIRMGCNFCHQV